MGKLLIGCYDGLIVYASESINGYMEIKFEEFPMFCDMTTMDVMRYQEFRPECMKKMSQLDRRDYGEYVYCRLNDSLYMINICDRRYEVIEKDFCGVCFMKNYILIAKDYPMEYFYKLTPPGKSTREIVKFM